MYSASLNDFKYFSSSIKKEILYVTAQEHAVPSSMLAMIKYIKAEKNDYEQLITVNSGKVIFKSTIGKNVFSLA